MDVHTAYLISFLYIGYKCFIKVSWLAVFEYRLINHFKFSSLFQIVLTKYKMSLLRQIGCVSSCFTFFLSFGLTSYRLFPIDCCMLILDHMGKIIGRNVLIASVQTTNKSLLIFFEDLERLGLNLGLTAVPIAIANFLKTFFC